MMSFFLANYMRFFRLHHRERFLYKHHYLKTLDTSHVFAVVVLTESGSG